MSTHSVPHPEPGRTRPLLDVGGLAHYLNVSVRHVRRLVAERRVPFYKVGYFVRFDPDEIDLWLTANHRPEQSVVRVVSEQRVPFGRDRLGRR